ncbi:MAG TPA: hypothetical protein VN830_01050 [Verrucomicrobiae bacterium]|nr:hypothetical protein [Verrucomicrobiae bacterium]
MTKVFLSVLLVLLVSIHLESTASCPAPEMANPAEEEYAVYGAVMKSLLRDYPELKLYIQPRTLSFECGKESCNTFQVGEGCSAMRVADQTPQGVLKALRQTFKELQKVTTSDFEKKNAHCGLLENRFPVERDYLWTGEDGKTAMGKRSVEEIPEEWKDADFLYFSRVGFDPEQKQALLYWGLFCHQDCGWFGWYLLSKRSGKWVMEANFQVAGRPERPPPDDGPVPRA